MNTLIKSRQMGLNSNQTPINGNSSPQMKQSIMRITPNKAREILKGNYYLDQRKIRKTHVALLKKLMESEHFRPETQTLHFAVNKEGDVYLINGYHTLYAIIDSNLEYDIPSRFQYGLYPEDIGEIYAAYDRGLTRHSLDSLRAMGVEELFDGMSSEVLRKIIAGITLFCSGYANSGSQRKIAVLDQDIMNLLDNKMYDAVESINQLFHIVTPSKGILNQLFFSILIPVILSNPTDGMSFLKAILNDEGKNKYSPARQFNKVQIGLRNARDKAEYILKLAYAWNKFIADEEVTRWKLSSVKKLDTVYYNEEPVLLPARFYKAIQTNNIKG